LNDITREPEVLTFNTLRVDIVEQLPVIVLNIKIIKQWERCSALKRVVLAVTFTLMVSVLISKKQQVLNLMLGIVQIHIGRFDNMWPAIAYGSIMAARFALGVIAVRGQSQHSISSIYLIPYYETEIDFYP
jgi:hypothetical protein